MYRLRIARTLPCLRRVWVVFFTVLICGFAIAVEPPAWAAPVPRNLNQTVPPFDHALLLPQLVAVPRLTNLTNHSLANCGYNHQPSCSFDGQRVAFVCEDWDAGEIRRIDADGSNPLLLAGASAEEGVTVYGAIWSADGSKIAYVQDGPERRHVYVMNADGSAKRDLVEKTNLSLDDLAWAPDGSRIAFVDGGAIFVIDPDGSNLTMLTREAGGDFSSAWYYSPVWSPDSSRIAAQDSRREAIWILDVESRDLTRLGNSSQVYSRFVWSPDGEMIAFVYQTIADRGEYEAGLEIGVVNVASGELTQVTSHFAGEHDLAWSPDSSKIVFSRSNDIHVVNADGSGHLILTQGFGEDRLPTWSPDGSQIAFVSYRENRHEVYAIGAGGGRPTRLTFNFSREDRIAWSPTGEHILINGYRENFHELRLVDVDGGNPSVLPDIPVAQVTWSPAAPQIAFLTGEWPALVEVYRADADLNNLVKISAGLAVKRFVWSPDGQQILLVASVEGGGYDLYLVGVDSTEPAKLITIPVNSVLRPVWSPDSKRLAFTNFLVGDGIYLLDVDSATLTHLTNSSDVQSNPVWSPDGKWLAYFGASSEVYLVDPEGGTPLQLTNDMLSDAAPLSIAWSPDSRKIAYVTDHPDPEESCGNDDPRFCPPPPTIYNLYLVDIDGSDHKVVAENAIDPRWSPNGRSLLFYSFDFGLALVDAAGNNLQKFGVQSWYSWSWVPDGHGILVDISGDIYLIHLPG